MIHDFLEQLLIFEKVFVASDMCYKIEKFIIICLLTDIQFDIILFMVFSFNELFNLDSKFLNG